MNNKFKVGDKVVVGKIVGKITDIVEYLATTLDGPTRYYRYEVTFYNTYDIGWFNEKNLELWCPEDIRLAITDDDNDTETKKYICTNIQRNVTAEEVEKLEEELRRKDSELRDLKELIINYCSIGMGFKED